MTLIETISSIAEYIESGNYYFSIGGENLHPALKCYIWLFMLADDSTSYNSYISQASSTICLSGGCKNSCNPSIVDSILKDGCISDEVKSNVDASGASCGSSSSNLLYGCIGSLSLNCLCEFYTCVVLNSAVVCRCPSIAQATFTTCICPTGYTFSEEKCLDNSCATFTSTYTCSTCIADNASPNSIGRCSCNDKFYGPDPPFKVDSCLTCNEECAKCVENLKCTTCISSNAFVDTIKGCKCNDGFWGIAPLNTLNSCVACYQDCATCPEELKCSTCKATNATPNINIGCTCNKYYYNITALTTSDSCKPCHSNCLTCDNSLTCLTCIESNAINTTEGGCKCKPEYTQIRNLTEDGSCILTTSAICQLGLYFDINTNQCMPCEEYCLNCTSLNVCLECKNNSTYGDQCLPCNSSCEECSGPGYYECTECSNVLLDGVCVNECALGFSQDDNKCVISNSNLPAISFDFKSSGATFIDQINYLQAVAIKKSRQRSLSDKLPFSTYSQGIYFPGDSALEISLSTARVFSGTFSISIWIKPSTTTGTILSKVAESNLLLSLSIENSYISFSLLLDSNFCNIKSQVSIQNELWSHIFITSQPTELNIIVNTILSNPYNPENIPFLDFINSTMYIGSDYLLENYYIGFIYLLNIYPYIEQLKLLAHTNTDCDGCDICLNTNVCIPICNIDEYYDFTSKKCFSCSSSCDSSCKNATHCSLCADDYCIKCSSFKTDSCTECINGYEIQNNLCYPCAGNQYYSSQTLTCQNCPDLCINCLSNTSCINCQENSSLNNNHLCECNKGFTYTASCIRNTFKASLMVNDHNEITIIFDENLQSTLESTCLETIVDGKKVKFDLVKSSKSVYVIIPKLDGTINSDATVNIKGICDIVSENNALLMDIYYQAKLFVSTEYYAAYKLKVKAKKAREMSKAGASAGVAAALGFSFFNLDPTSFFDFMNTAEMFIAAFLMNNTLNLVLSEFLLGLRIGDLLPDFYDYVLPENGGISMPEKFGRMGMPTNLFWVNAKPEIISLIISIVILIFALLASNCTWCYIKLSSFRSSFKYTFFLRFWLQTYFELLLISSFGIRYGNFSSAPQIVSFILCCLCLMLQFSGIVIFIYCLYKRSKLTEASQIELFEKKFGTFFDDFKPTGISNWLTYVFFILRRTALVLSYHFINDGSMQMSIAIGFSLSIPLYILLIRNFKNFYQLCFNLVNEIIIAGYYGTILFGFIYGNSIMSEENAYICIYFIISAWLLNLAFSVISNITGIYRNIKKIIIRITKNRRDRVYRVDTITEVQGKNAKTQTLEI
ncbi:hypothetical protein SteCoe_4848 [Stentor coeruleus]|uniref:EGF-like domain-containing protein n=1 Tax=Stentor coeruleus TaxID=5963 RepID=A0A1R2CTU4_9CILI|nr:hypothetical protein SteCoe_4848 [Stentor coeruleus]